MNPSAVLLRGLLATVVASTALLSVSAAEAQTEDQKEKAKVHFTQGRRLYDVGRYQDAIDEYQKAYLNVEDPVFLYNIAQAYRLNNDPENALRFYKNFLRRAPATPNRAEVEEKMADMQKILDGRRKPDAPPPPPDTVTPPPPPPPDTKVTPPPPPPPDTTPPPPDTTVTPVTPVTTTGDDTGLKATASTPGSSGKRTTGYILVAGGGGLIAVAALAGAIASSKAREVEKAVPPNAFDPDVEKSGKMWNSIAIVSGVAGVAAAGIGLYLLLTNKSSDATVDSTNTAKQSRGSQLAVFPTLAPDYAGAGASLTF